MGSNACDIAGTLGRFSLAFLESVCGHWGYFRAPHPMQGYSVHEGVDICD